MRFLKALSIVPVLALTVAAPAMANVNLPDQQAVGLYVSNIAGSGLTYGHTFGSGWGFHVSGVGYSDGTATSFFNVGGALTRDITVQSWGRIYGLCAVGAALSGYKGGEGIPSSASLQADVAPGVGATWGPVMAEIGYSFYPGQHMVGFTPAGGLGLVWNF